MTKLLDSAFKEAESLSKIEQNMFAQFIIDEIHSKKKWDETFANSEDVLAELADDALNEYKEGNTETINIDKL
jgi:hypothetical protein